MKSEFSGKHVEAIQEVFGDASPIRAGQLKQVNKLKASMEVDSEKSKQKISLIIQDKGDSPRRIKK